MGIGIDIGILDENGRIVHCTEKDAPVFPGDWMNPGVNAHHCRISSWMEFARRTGVFLLAEANCFGEWIFGSYEIVDDDISDARDAVSRTNVEPRYDRGIEESDAARARWLLWWLEHARRTHGDAARIYVSY